MSVEVIKQGDKNMAECKFCGAVLRYSREDVKERERYLTQRDTYTERYITCTDCNSDVILKYIK